MVHNVIQFRESQSNGNNFQSMIFNIFLIVCIWHFLNEYTKNKQPTSSNIIQIPLQPDLINHNVVKNSPVPGFKQIGTLNTHNKILPLFGKSTLPSSTYHLPYLYGEDTWNYYTQTEHNVIIPLEFEKDLCMKDTGCKRMNNNDQVFISQYNDNFVVKLYEEISMHHN